MTSRLVVIGVGNAYRSDDAAGLEVVRRLSPVDGVRLIEHEGHGAGLLDAWQGAAAAIVIDAASSGAPPGTIQRFDAAARSLPARLFVSSSTHSFGVPEAIELARSLGRLPASLTAYAIEGAKFEAGTELSPEVDAAVDSLVAELQPRLTNTGEERPMPAAASAPSVSARASRASGGRARRSQGRRC